MLVVGRQKAGQKRPGAQRQGTSLELGRDNPSVVQLLPQDQRLVVTICGPFCRSEDLYGNTNYASEPAVTSGCSFSPRLSRRTTTTARAPLLRSHEYHRADNQTRGLAGEKRTLRPNAVVSGGSQPVGLLGAWRMGKS